MIKKIISGGQAGADRAALDAAIKLGIPHGGWVPKGRRTEDGPLPDKYHLQEMPTISYTARMEKNVLDSDGTVILTHGKLTVGTKMTKAFARKQKRPCLHIDLDEIPRHVAGSILRTWMRRHGIEILNVVGARASKDTIIYEEVFKIIEGVVVLAQTKAFDGEDNS